MDRRAFLLEMRKSGQLKGQKPCFVIVKPKDNDVCKVNGQFVMSYDKGVLYFQKISRLFGMLRPQEDFKIYMKDFSFYDLIHKASRSIFTLYKENGERLPIEYMTGTKETFTTEDNVGRIIREITEIGIKKMEMKKIGE